MAVVSPGGTPSAARKKALHFAPFFFIKSPVLNALNKLIVEKFEEEL
jgi:hypothetical protein